jgi:predicted 2-oxoglutarate/Fe(II)-dependent dioxygenase YbiX
LDYSLETIQVALNDEAEYNGGRLVYATQDGQLHKPPRSAGFATWHDHSIVHGVTELTSGVRYGLFLIHKE